MSIDKQRIAAVAALEALGFKYTSNRGWIPPINSGCGAIGGILPDSTAEADAMHALLVTRADALDWRAEVKVHLRFCELHADVEESPNRARNLPQPCRCRTARRHALDAVSFKQRPLPGCDRRAGERCRFCWRWRLGQPRPELAPSPGSDRSA